MNQEQMNRIDELERVTRRLDDTIERLRKELDDHTHGHGAIVAALVDERFRTVTR